MTSDGLPDYETPPVVETILGVQFDAIERLSTPFLSLFWSSLRDEWPIVVEAAYLESKFERFGAGQPWSDLRVQLKEGHPPIRLQMKKEASDWMIQVQNSRLHVNWIGYEGNRESGYPRYPSVREQFESALGQFRRFIGGEKLGDISPNQWEVTYVNHIPVGSVWNSPHDWKFMQLLGDGAILGKAADLEAFQGGWRFALPNEGGRLHVSWKTARRRHPDNVDIEQQIVILEQTARGPLSANCDTDGILRGIDTGRETIVKSFTQMMDDDANKYWGIQR